MRNILFWIIITILCNLIILITCFIPWACAFFLNPWFSILAAITSMLGIDSCHNILSYFFEDDDNGDDNDPYYYEFED